MSQLTCQHLSLGYDGREIISNLSFHVDAGDYLCIVGENGSGKSTLMKTLLGLRRPMKGEITTGDGLTANTIGYLPQQTVVQKDFPASVREIVISGFQGRRGLRPFYTRAEKRIALENIKKMGIEHLQNRCYRELSGGQQQRVLLARALCATQKMLHYDFPRYRGCAEIRDPCAAHRQHDLLRHPPTVYRQQGWQAALQHERSLRKWKKYL